MGKTVLKIQMLYAVVHCAVVLCENLLYDNIYYFNLKMKQNYFLRQSI